MNIPGPIRSLPFSSVTRDVSTYRRRHHESLQSPFLYLTSTPSSWAEHILFTTVEVDQECSVVERHTPDPPLELVGRLDLTSKSCNLWKPEGLHEKTRTVFPNAAAISCPFSLAATQLLVSGDVSSSKAMSCDGVFAPPLKAIKD